MGPRIPNDWGNRVRFAREPSFFESSCAKRSRLAYPVLQHEHSKVKHFVMADKACRNFQPNIFNKSKCQNCYKLKEAHRISQTITDQKSLAGLASTTSTPAPTPTSSFKVLTVFIRLPFLFCFLLLIIYKFTDLAPLKPHSILSICFLNRLANLRRSWSLEFSPSLFKSPAETRLKLIKT